MSSIRGHVVDLARMAKRAEGALVAISRAARDATKLSTGAIFGSLGFVLGAGGAFSGLAAAAALIYAPFLVPVAGISGLLIGVLAGRDKIDRANELAINLVDQAWSLRDREIETLSRQIKEAQRLKAPQLSQLEEKRAHLLLAPPEVLVRYFGLFERSVPYAGTPHPLLVGPAEVKALPPAEAPPRQIEDRRQTVLDGPAGK